MNTISLTIFRPTGTHIPGPHRSLQGAMCAVSNGCSGPGVSRRLRFLGQIRCDDSK